MALPLIFWNSSTSSTPNKNINVNEIKSFDKVDVPAAPTGGAADYQIVIAMKGGNTAPLVIKMSYTTSTLRNASLAALLAIVATTTV